MSNDDERDYAEEAANRVVDHGEVTVMVTLTYPHNREAALGHHMPGAATKHLAELADRYRRAWGEDLTSQWAIEVLRSGAPALHLLMVPPVGEPRAGAGAGLTFREWISATWSDMVAPSEPGEYARHLRAGVSIHHEESLDDHTDWLLRGTTPAITVRLPCPLGDECPECNLCTRAQIKAWADALDTTAESLNDHCLPVVAEMRAWLASK